MIETTTEVEQKLNEMVATTEQMIVDLADAESRDELLFATNKILSIVNHHDEAMHDLEVKDGVVTALARKLTKAVSSHHRSSRAYYKSKIAQDRTLQISLLVTLLEHIILRSSPTALSSYVDKALTENLMASLVQVIHMFSSYGNQVAIHDVGLSKAVRIVECLSNQSGSSSQSTDILKAMLLIIGREVSLDIRTDAALTISSFSSRDGIQHPKQWNIIIKSSNVSEPITTPHDSIDGVAGMLIATLTTATKDEDNNMAASAMNGLCRLSYHSSHVRVMMAKRRDFAIVVSNNLGKTTSTNMKLDALNIVENLLFCQDSLAILLAAPGHTGEILEQNLISCILDDNNKIQEHSIRIVQEVVSTHRYQFTSQFQPLLEAIDTIVNSSNADDTTTLHAAKVLSKVTIDMEVPRILRPKVVSLAGKLITHPNEKICLESICALKYISRQSENHHALVRDLEFMWNLSRIIDGSRGTIEIAGALDILLCLVTEACHREVVARNSRLMSALQAVILRKTIVNHKVYMVAVEVILKILRDDNTLLNFIDLLPWLVNFANSTTSDKLKEGLVDAAMKISTALLH